MSEQEEKRLIYGAVIVAAGMSTRMKQFKQLMRIGDMSLAERVIVNFRRAGVRDIVMITGHNADQLEKALKDFNIVYLRNEAFETTEMFDSVRIGFQYMTGRCDRLFFCPVDVPFFTDETVSREIREMDAHPEVHVIVPNKDGRDGHPLLIDGSVLPDILAHDGTRGLKGAYESLPEGSVLRMPVEDEGAVTDADTQDDFQKLIDIHNNRILHSDIRIRFVSTTPFFGIGTVRLLRRIEECGNVREACEKCNISYSKGWTILRGCEEKFGYSIVDRQPGGQNGGTATVTEKGKKLLSIYDELERDIARITEARFQQLMREYDLIQ